VVGCCNHFPLWPALRRRPVSYAMCFLNSSKHPAIVAKGYNPSCVVYVLAFYIYNNTPFIYSANFSHSNINRPTVQVFTHTRRWVSACAGVKSVLDIPKTLEVLETHGVPVATLPQGSAIFLSALSNLTPNLQRKGVLRLFVFLFLTKHVSSQRFLTIFGNIHLKNETSEL